jgi:CBS domain containing-hemolysin-like protein
MSKGAILLAIIVASAAVLFFSTLTFALRDFSRIRLEQWLKRRDRADEFESTVEHADDYAFVTALLRLLCNILVLICVLYLFHDTESNLWLQYLYAFLITGAISAVASVAVPLAIARHVGEMVIALCVPALHAMYGVLYPCVAAMRAIDHLVGRAAGPQTEEQEQQAIEEQILTAVEQGEKEGVVDEQEREMIESVIDFRDVRVNEVMTSRPDIVAMECDMGLTMVREVFQKTGHSRIPVFEGSLDHIVGVLYARDLLHYVGERAEAFDVRKAVRPAFFVPETKRVNWDKVLQLLTGLTLIKDLLE